MKNQIVIVILAMVIFNCVWLHAATINHPGDFGTIQDAIDDAGTVDGDEIVVAPGTYFESINFLGKAITLRASSSDPNDTIIDGTGFFHVVQCVNYEDPDTVLAGFTITGGVADGAAPPDDRGAGMYNYHSSPTVTNCIFSDNHAKESSLGVGGEGGGMYNDNSDPTVTDCIFRDNTSKRYGGGMFNSFSSPTVTGSTFITNMAKRIGGGMFNLKSSPTVTGCTFTGNLSTEGNGGGMVNIGSNSTVTGCSFIGNSATNGGGGGMSITDSSDSSTIVTDCLFIGNSAKAGGGMINSGSNSTVTGCSFIGNSATNGDGGGMRNGNDSSTIVTGCTFIDNTANSIMFIYGNGGGIGNSGSSSPIVTDCTFSGNLAEHEGGGIYNLGGSSPMVSYCKFINNKAINGGGIRNIYGCNSIVTNCIFSRNFALDGNGAGMSNFSSHPEVLNCTFSDNQVTSNPAGGGGMNNESYSRPIVANTIFWGNLPDQVDYDGTSTRDITYSLVQGGSLGIGNIDEDPLFVDAALDDLHLQAGSGAIDAGNNFLTGGPLDLDWNTRIIDDPATVDMGVGGPPTVDMGAYEFGVSICLCDNGLVGDNNCDGVVNLLDFGLMYMHWQETI